MNPPNEVERHFIVLMANIDNTKVYELDFGSRLTGANNVSRDLWDLIYFGMEVAAGGTGVTYDPKVSETNPPAATDEECRLNYAAPIAVATITRDQFDPPTPFAVTPGGKLYFAPRFDAGADNNGVAVLRFRARRGLAIMVS